MDRKNNDGGHDLSTHPLISIHEPPAALVAFRSELVLHTDISAAASKETTFEGAIATVAEKLGIIVDGMYDPIDLLSMLTEALKSRGSFAASPHLRAKGLMDVELIEKEGTVELVERDREVATLLPEDTVVSEVDTTGKKKGIQ